MTRDDPSFDTIFSGAIEIASGEERAAFVARACGTDEELRRRVERLVDAHFQAGSFLESPPASHTSSMASSSPTELSGALIGPYKLLQVIGEGGMGTVYMAEQTEPVRRTVALKLIKPGMDSRQVLARFGAERQALALMDHPNIAKVLDAGAADSGRPYFVMELVKGIPITTYCDQRKLTLRERLELAIPVCQAVQHAHQKGIIHRDIKPSNVLIALYDGKPVPKVIDFGVAKATGPRLTDQTLYTEFGAIVGTLEYMSPEQAELNQLDIDTRSDIYSLGVLLYELLTGSTPLERRRLKEVLFLEILRAIREEESPRPSMRLSTTQELPSIAACRHIEPRKLSGLVRGELDWIVMKALEKDRKRRYETANGLAADLRRYLDDEPVQACPPSARYRFGKFARRRRTALLTAGLVSAALVLGTIVSAWQALVAIRARQGETAHRIFAEQQRQRAEVNFQKALDAVDQMLTQVGQDDLASVPHLEQVRRNLLQKALRFYEQFLEEDSSDPVVRREAGMASRRVSEIQQKLGNDAKAQEALDRSIDLLERLEVEVPGEPRHAQELARSLDSQGALLLRKERADDAITAFQKALALRTRLVAEYPDGDPEYRHDLARSQNVLGGAWTRTSQMLEAEEAYRTAIRLEATLAAEFPTNPVFRSDLATFLTNLASARKETGQFAEAEDTYRQAIAIQQQLVAADPAERAYEQKVVASYLNLGTLLWESSRPPEAESAFRQSLTLIEGLARDFPSVPNYRRDLGGIQANLGNLLCATGREPEGEATLGKALEVHEKLVADFPGVPGYQSALGATLHNLATRLKSSPDKLGQARTLFERAIVHQQAALDLNPRNLTYNSFLINHRDNLALTLQALGQNAEAERVYRRNLAHQARLIAEFPKAPEYLSTHGATLHNLAELLSGQEKVDEARPLLEQAIVEQQAAREINPRNSTYRRFLHNHCLTLARVLVKQANPDAASDVYRRALSLDQELVDAAPNVPAYRSQLGATLHDFSNVIRDKGDLAQARQLLERAITEQRAALKISPQHPTYLQYLRNHYLNLTDVLIRQGDHEEAARMCEELARVRPENANDTYDAASVVSLAVRVARNDPKLTQAERNAAAAAHGDQAIALLERAVATGFKDFEFLKTDPDLEAIREHPGFKEVLRKRK
jgi:eukaryotic-like serine/threonine-protein kinase